MIIHWEIDQNSEEWDNHRKIRPTGSEYDKIYTGGGKVSDQRETYMRRLSVARKYAVPQFTGNKWTDRGNKLEPESRKRFTEETGYELKEAGFIDNDNGITGFSPDGLVMYNGDPVATFETKSYKLDKHMSIVNGGVLPKANMPQVHGALFNSKLTCAIFALYCPEAWPLDFYMIEVTPDDYTKRLEDQVYEFCDEYEIQGKWKQYLAEYEVDKLNRDTATALPVLSTLMNREEMVI